MGLIPFLQCIYIGGQTFIVCNRYVFSTVCIRDQPHADSQTKSSLNAKLEEGSRSKSKKSSQVSEPRKTHPPFFLAFYSSQMNPRFQLNPPSHLAGGIATPVVALL